MQHTLVAVFDNSTDAQKAMDDLLASGFSRSDVRLSNDTSRTDTAASTTTAGDESFGDSIKNFFADLFGSDSTDRSSMYSDAVSRGNCVLTVTTQSEPEVERAADVVEAHGPIDIDEHHDMPMGGTSGMRAAAMARGAPQTSQPSAQSMQSGSGASMGSSTMSSQGAATGNSRQFAESDSQAIPVVREELKVGKREVQRGGVRIFSHVVEEPVDESLSLREEHVSVQRRSVDQPIDPSDVRAFKDTTIEMRESAEEATVQKSARVVEEVTIGKEVTNREEHIRDTLRHTEVEVEKLSGSNDDDDYYRSHWNSNFAGSGKSYNEVAPAYQYGSSMRRSELYRGRPWEDVETDLRSDWTQRNPGSTWESMKAAVRHGWDRLTN